MTAAELRAKFDDNAGGASSTPRARPAGGGDRRGRDDGRRGDVDRHDCGRSDRSLRRVVAARTATRRASATDGLDMGLMLALGAVTGLLARTIGRPAAGAAERGVPTSRAAHALGRSRSAGRLHQQRREPDSDGAAGGAHRPRARRHQPSELGTPQRGAQRGARTRRTSQRWELRSPLHWFENIKPKNSRAWLVVDPPDGRIPPHDRRGAGPRGGARRGAQGPRRGRLVGGPQPLRPLHHPRRCPAR